MNEEKTPRTASLTRKGAAVGLVCLLLFVIAPGLSHGEDGEALKKAGDDAKFRVIQRFDDEDDAEQEASSKTSDSSPLAALLGPQASAKAIVPGELHEAITREAWDEAHDLIDGAQSKAGERVAARRAELDFLSGYVAWKRENFQEAFKSMKAALDAAETAEQNGEEPFKLADYASYYAAHSAFSEENFHDATMYAVRVPRESLLYDKSLMLLAESLIETGTDSDLQRAVRALQAYLRHFPNGSSAASAHFELAKILGERGDWNRAERHFRTILSEHPVSSSAGATRRHLRNLKDEGELPESLKELIDSPPRDFKMAYYRAMYQSHRSETVVKKLSGEVKQWTPGDPDRCEALYLVARSHTKLRNHGDASPWYEDILDECAGIGSWRLKALYMGGKSYWNDGDKEKAIERFRTIWTDFSSHSYADDAMYFVARIHRERGDEEKAREMLRRQVETYPRGDMATDAHWLLIREMLESEDYADIVEYVDNLATDGNDVYSKGRMAYIRARALEEMGKTKAAGEGFREVVKAHPMGYYAFLSFNRLAALESPGRTPSSVEPCSLGDFEMCAPSDANEEAKDEEDERRVSIPESVRTDSHFEKGIQLLRLGLKPLANNEFRRLFGSFGDEPEALWGLAALLDAAGNYRLSHQIPHRRIDGWKDGYPTGDELFWQLSYPAAFDDAVEEWASQRNLPKSLVWAIMREESGFTPEIESWANAYGLMQLIWPTAERIAGVDGYNLSDSGELLEPKTNIRLGTAYMRELGDQLDSHPALIIAGYNGGYGNVSRWLEARGDLPLDLWIEDIPYGQTRKYTKRVLTTFWAYTWLYAEDKKVPALSFELPS